MFKKILTAFFGPPVPPSPSAIILEEMKRRLKSEGNVTSIGVRDTYTAALRVNEERGLGLTSEQILDQLWVAITLGVNPAQEVLVGGAGAVEEFANQEIASLRRQMAV